MNDTLFWHWPEVYNHISIILDPQYQPSLDHLQVLHVSMGGRPISLSVGDFKFKFRCKFPTFDFPRLKPILFWLNPKLQKLKKVQNWITRGPMAKNYKRTTTPTVAPRPSYLDQNMLVKDSKTSNIFWIDKGRNKLGSSL